jgi:transposase
MSEVQFLKKKLSELAMKAYSLDLRQKIIDTYLNEEISQRQLAKRFRVATSFIIKLLKQYRETGKIEPLAHGGGAKLKVTPEQLEILAEIIEDNNDATLQELCQIFQDKTDLVVSRATMGRMSKRLNLTVKKNTSCSREAK